MAAAGLRAGSVTAKETPWLLVQSQKFEHHDNMTLPVHQQCLGLQWQGHTWQIYHLYDYIDWAGWIGPKGK